MAASGATLRLRRALDGRLIDAEVALPGRPTPPRRRKPFELDELPTLGARTVLGEPCQERDTASPDDEVSVVECAAADGLVLARRHVSRGRPGSLQWKRPLNPDGDRDEPGEAVRVERREVTDDDLIPVNVFDLARWRDPSPPHVNGPVEGADAIYRVDERPRPTVLLGVPSFRTAARTVALNPRSRRDEITAYGETVMTYEDASIPIVARRASSSTGADVLTLARPRPVPRTLAAAPLARRLIDAVGEACEEPAPLPPPPEEGWRWGVGVMGILECRTADGVVLARRHVLGSDRDPYNGPAERLEEAVSLRRGGVRPEDVAPPAGLFEPLRWGLPGSAFRR